MGDSYGLSRFNRHSSLWRVNQHQPLLYLGFSEHNLAVIDPAGKTLAVENDLMQPGFAFLVVQHRYLVPRFIMDADLYLSCLRYHVSNNRRGNDLFRFAGNSQPLLDMLYGILCGSRCVKPCLYTHCTRARLLLRIGGTTGTSPGQQCQNQWKKK
jgi:hypothetical protein